MIANPITVCSINPAASPFYPTIKHVPARPSVLPSLPTNTMTTTFPDGIPPTCVALSLSPRNRAGPICEHQDRPICLPLRTQPKQSHCSPSDPASLILRPGFITSHCPLRARALLLALHSVRSSQVVAGLGVVDVQFSRHGPFAVRVRARASAHVCDGGWFSQPLTSLCSSRTSVPSP